jgi:hypothetical protein
VGGTKTPLLLQFERVQDLGERRIIHNTEPMNS